MTAVHRAISKWRWIEVCIHILSCKQKNVSLHQFWSEHLETPMNQEVPIYQQRYQHNRVKEPKVLSVSWVHLWVLSNVRSPIPLLLRFHTTFFLFRLWDLWELNKMNETSFSLICGAHIRRWSSLRKSGKQNLKIDRRWISFISGFCWLIHLWIVWFFPFNLRPLHEAPVGSFESFWKLNQSHI